MECVLRTQTKGALRARNIYMLHRCTAADTQALVSAKTDWAGGRPEEEGAAAPLSMGLSFDNHKLNCYLE